MEANDKKLSREDALDQVVSLFKLGKVCKQILPPPLGDRLAAFLNDKATETLPAAGLPTLLSAVRATTGGAPPAPVAGPDVTVVLAELGILAEALETNPLAEAANDAHMALVMTGDPFEAVADEVFAAPPEQVWEGPWRPVPTREAMPKRRRHMGGSLQERAAAVREAMHQPQRPEIVLTGTPAEQVEQLYQIEGLSTPDLASRMARIVNACKTQEEAEAVMGMIQYRDLSTYNYLLNAIPSDHFASAKKVAQRMELKVKEARLRKLRGQE